MLKNLVLRLYYHSEITFQLADKVLRSLEPLEFKSEAECIRSLASIPEIQCCGNLLGPEDPFSPPQRILDQLVKRGIKTICRWEDGYPSHLREIASPPVILFYQGFLPNPEALSIGVVGARKGTQTGLQAARDFSRTLAEHGISTISGLADGIDTAAHDGALSADGYTLAVLGCGINHTYPASNISLRQRILDSGGGILSEFPPPLPARTWNFPRRNRIISGLSSGVIIIEAGVKSGSLITAKYALDQNRDLFAVPGSIRSPVSEGTNQLIKYGAVPVTEGIDIIRHYDLSITPIRSSTPSKPDLSPDELSLIKTISALGTATVDELTSATHFTVPQLLGCLAALEIKGAVDRWITGQYVLSK